MLYLYIILSLTARNNNNNNNRWILQSNHLVYIFSDEILDKISVVGFPNIARGSDGTGIEKKIIMFDIVTIIVS